MPAIAKRLAEKPLSRGGEPANNILLSTIRFPKNLHYLTERLPKATYLQEKTLNSAKEKTNPVLVSYDDFSTKRKQGGLVKIEGVKVSESVDSSSRKHNVPVLLPIKGKKDDLYLQGGYGRPKQNIKQVNPQLSESIEKDNLVLEYQRRLREQKIKELERERRGREKERSVVVGVRDYQNSREKTESSYSSEIKRLERDILHPSPKPKRSHLDYYGNLEERGDVSFIPGDAAKKASLEKQTYIQQIYGIKNAKRLQKELSKYQYPPASRKLVVPENQIKEQIEYLKQKPKLAEGEGDARIARLPPIIKNSLELSPMMDGNKRRINELSKAYNIKPVESRSTRNPSLNKKEKSGRDPSVRVTSLEPHYLEGSIHIMKYGSPKQINE